MTIYDFDGMFDVKLREYMDKNNEIKGEKWEDIIPVLYKKFGDVKIKSIGKSPNEYYKDVSIETLIKILSSHLKQNVSVDGFLKNRLDETDCKKFMLSLLDGCEAEKEFAVNYLGEYEPAIEKYMDVIESECDVSLMESCVSAVKKFADALYDRLVSNYKNGVQAQIMLDILSCCLKHRQEVFNLLISAFNCDDEHVIENAANIANFGDERALPYLYKKLEEEAVNYLQFREIKFAIETLGGECESERDFSGDEAYEAIKKHTEENADIFSKLFNK